MSGFIAFWRAALDHPLLDDANRLGAWTWLLGRAAWKDTPFRVHGQVVILKRGQLCVSLRQLGEAWKWPKSTVDRFLTRLENGTMIQREAGQGRLIITIENYDKYQALDEPLRDNNPPERGTGAGQQRDTKEQGNKGTTEERPNGLSLVPFDQNLQLAFDRYTALRGDFVPNARAIDLSNTRRRALQARLKEIGGLAEWDAVLAQIRASPFLRGETSRNGFVAELDWLLKPANLTKVREGNYDDKGTHHQPAGNGRHVRPSTVDALIEARARLGIG